MATSKSRAKRKPIAKRTIGSTLAVLIIAGVSVGLYIHHRSTTNAALASQSQRAVNSIDYSPSKPSDNAANNERKSNPSSASPTLDNGATTPTQPASFSATITRAGTIGDQFEVASLVNGVTSGTCTVSISQTGQTTLTQTGQVTAQTNSYGCPVFSFPVSEFPNAGKWNVSLSVISGGSTTTTSWAGNPVSPSGQ